MSRGGDPGGARRDVSARDVAREVLVRVDAGQGFATSALADGFAATRLDERDRRLAAELVHGVARHRSRLDRALGAHAPRGLDDLPPRVRTALRVGAYQLLFLRVPAHAAVDDAVDAVRAAVGRGGGARLAGFANGVLRALARAGEPPLPGAPGSRKHVEAVCSLPHWLGGALLAALPGGDAELAAAAEALQQPAPLVVRVQLGRIDRDALAARLAAEHPDATIAPSRLVPGALVTSGLGDPDASPSFRDGLWTVQDTGAQLVGWLAGVRPGDRVLDACAGVGGKSAHLAELLGAATPGAPAGLIHAVDLAAAKLDRLAETAARLGLPPDAIRREVVDLLDADATQRALLPSYDVVVLDAPCSGLGVLRRHPEARWRLAAADLPRMAALQAQLLDVVAARVRPGGILVYSVCTFSRAEGPEQLESFLARAPFRLAPPPAGSAVPWPEVCDARGVMTTWPHRHGADAFFAARLERISDVVASTR